MASKSSGNLIQIKASGLMCSFCTMSVEKALGRVPGVNNVQVNLVHGIILVDADRNRVSEQDVARKVEDLGYTVVATEAQQYKTDEALFATIKRRGILGVALALTDTLFDPLNVFGLPDRAQLREMRPDDRRDGLSGLRLRRALGHAEDRRVSDVKVSLKEGTATLRLVPTNRVTIERIRERRGPRRRSSLPAVTRGELEAHGEHRLTDDIAAIRRHQVCAQQSVLPAFRGELDHAVLAM